MADTEDGDSEDVEGPGGAGEAGGDRIAKVMARAGLCSRREAERWIALGRVKLNGAQLDTPAVVIRPGDRVEVDGRPLPSPEPPRLWRYHKPAGLVTTHRDPEGRPTVFDHLPSDLPRVLSIGRLDLTSEGLLLLTNDGGLARHLELPSTGWIRRYRARVYGIVDPAALEKIADGVTVEGVAYGPIDARLERQLTSNAWLTLSLSEGKNREVRRVLEHLGYPVQRLIRISYGPFQLGNLPAEETEEVRPAVLRSQLGRTLDTLAGVPTRPKRPAEGGPKDATGGPARPKRPAAGGPKDATGGPARPKRAAPSGPKDTAGAAGRAPSTRGRSGRKR